MSDDLEKLDPPPGPSELASRLRRVKEAALYAAERRSSRVPVPLYWSLFHSQIADAKAVRAHQRALRKIIFGVD